MDLYKFTVRELGFWELSEVEPTKTGRLPRHSPFSLSATSLRWAHVRAQSAVALD
jgi:hypothetical protein